MLSRRLLGPFLGPMLFVVVAALVFGVLGWVTYAALGVEQAQREAAARAELGSNLRIALWHLDARMLPALGVEDSRPYYQYGPADPNFGYGVATTPLLVTSLPNWMKLHFQLDAADGWQSPQVLSEDVAGRVQEAWPDLVLCNVNKEREQVLAELRQKFPARETLSLLTLGDKTLPLDGPTPVEVPANGGNRPQAGPTSDAIPLAPVPNATSPSGVSSASSSPLNSQRFEECKTLRLFGIEIRCPREQAPANSTTFNYKRPESTDALKKADAANSAAAARYPSTANQEPQVGRSGRNGSAQRDNDNARANDGMARDETINRAMKDVQPTPGNGQAKNQANFANNNLQNSFYSQNPLGNEARPQTNPQNPQLGLNGMSNSSPTNGFVPPSSSPMSANPAVPSASGVVPVTPLAPPTNVPSQNTYGVPVVPKVEGPLSQTGTANPPANVKNRVAGEANKAGPFPDQFGEVVRPMPMPTPPGIAVPPPNWMMPPAIPAPAQPAPPMAIHLGSMRPQWIIGADDSEVLALVRIAKVDRSTVCQGIILDWARLQEMLKEEVKELFPNAHLIPITDASTVSPERAMTALPVQLDPGVRAEPPPTGWTTLRLGLALAWTAAIIVVGAVGFCGWTLLDLAERRIRFVSAVTHELRTPLTSLRLYLDLLVSGMIQDEDKRREYLNTLASESDRLHRLIDNVLDFAKLERRRTTSAIAPVTVASLLDQLRQTWIDRLAQDGKELLVVSTLAEGREVRTDAAMIQQIVGNLIDNARKYSRDAADKRIWVWARPGKGNAVVIEVEDRGPGVPANERRSIFRPYRRGEHADRTTGGAGLGLALAKAWIETLGGTLSYRPADGGTGACFRLELSGK